MPKLHTYVANLLKSHQSLTKGQDDSPYLLK